MRRAEAKKAGLATHTASPFTPPCQSHRFSIHTASPFTLPHHSHPNRPIMWQGVMEMYGVAGFQPSDSFHGSRVGLTFGNGAAGLGYYLDVTDSFNDARHLLPSVQCQGATEANLRRMCWMHGIPGTTDTKVNSGGLDGREQLIKRLVQSGMLDLEAALRAAKQFNEENPQLGGRPRKKEQATTLPIPQVEIAGVPSAAGRALNGKRVVIKRWDQVSGLYEVEFEDGLVYFINPVFLRLQVLRIGEPSTHFSTTDANMALSGQANESLTIKLKSEHLSGEVDSTKLMHPTPAPMTDLTPAPDRSGGASVCGGINVSREQDAVTVPRIDSAPPPHPPLGYKEVVERLRQLAQHAPADSSNITFFVHS